MKNSKVFILLVFGLLGVGIQAQDTLSTTEAIAQLLEQNYNLRIASNNLERAQISAVPGNVGYYPSVALTGGVDLNFGGAVQNLQNGDKISASANLTQVYNSAVTVNYPIYQGGFRQNSLSQLQRQVQQLELQKRLTAQQEIVQMLTLYYQAVEVQEALLLQQELIDLSQDRLQRALTDYELGRGNSLEINNARVDLQRDSSTYITTLATLNQSKREILFALGEVEGKVDFGLQRDIHPSLALSLEKLKQKALENNALLLLVEEDEALLQLDREILKAQYLPELNFVTQYSFRFQDFGTGGFFSTQRTNGLGGGINLSYNIYDGGRRKIQKQTLEVNQQEIVLRRAQLQAEILNDLSNAYYNYQAAMELNTVEKSAIVAAREALRRSKEEYQLGRLGQLEFRQAQINLYQTQLAERRSAISAKLLEVQIRNLAGMLLEEGQ